MVKFPAENKPNQNNVLLIHLCYSEVLLLLVLRSKTRPDVLTLGLCYLCVHMLSWIGSSDSNCGWVIHYTFETPNTITRASYTRRRHLTSTANNCPRRTAVGTSLAHCGGKYYVRYQRRVQSRMRSMKTHGDGTRWLRR